mgnify:FL=1
MYSKLKPGDLLHRSKGIVQHAGVYLGDGQVFHNQPGNGADVTSYEQYANGEIVKVSSSTGIDHELLSERLREIIGKDKRYGFLSNNCEHAANFLILGRSMSPQAQAGLAGAVIGVLIGNQINAENWVYCAALGGLAGLLIANKNKNYDYSIANQAI